MPLDTQIFFQVILSGFVIVWAFRKRAQRTEKITDFEYLGLSAFWGLILLVFMEWLPGKDPEAINKLLANPYATGFVFSIIGGIIAGWVGTLSRHDYDDSETRFIRFIHTTWTRFRGKFRKK